MKREIKLNKYEVNARACKITAKSEVEVELITAVDLKGSKAILTASGDFGMVVYNELNFGFMISWKEFEIVQSALKISEENYEDFLDNFTNDFSDTIIDFVNEK